MGGNEGGQMKERESQKHERNQKLCSSLPPQHLCHTNSGGALNCSGVGWCLHWRGVCSWITTTPGGARRVSAAAPHSYRLSRQMVILLPPCLSAGTQLQINVLLPGFRTPLGVWVVGGLHCLPVWLYPCRWESCPTGWSCLCGSSMWGCCCWLQAAC